MRLNRTILTLACEDCGEPFPSSVVHDGDWRHVDRLVACDNCRYVSPHSVVEVGATTAVVFGQVAPTSPASVERLLVAQTA